MYLDQSKRVKDYKNMVASYYDTITEPYRKFWGDFFHPAMYDNKDDDAETAFLKTHMRMLQDSNLRIGSNAIDLGCGVGSLANFLAKERQCNVVGVTLSDLQIRKARELAKKKNISGVSFVKADIMEIDKMENSGGFFDAAFMIDVGCHLPNKDLAVKNVSKILKKGGRFVICDWLRGDSVNYFEKQLLIEPFNMYWNLPYMESMENYKKIFKKYGFEIIKAEDVSDKVKKNWDEFYKVAIEQINDLSLKRMLSFVNNPEIVLNNKRFMQITRDQFYANVFAKVCSDAGVFRYGYFVVQKK